MNIETSIIPESKVGKDTVILLNGKCMLQYPIVVNKDVLEDKYSFKTTNFEWDIVFHSGYKLNENLVSEIMVSVRVDAKSGKHPCSEFDTAMDNFIKILMLRNQESIGFNHKPEYIFNTQFDYFQKSYVNETGLKKIEDSDIQYALDNINKDIKLQYLLLTSSYTFYYKSDFRNCVLSCATIIEICLAEFILKELKKNNIGIEQDTAIQELIIKNCNGLIGLYKFLNKLNEIYLEKLSKTSLQNKICEIRNKTIHKGYVPNANESMDAIKICEYFLESNYKTIFVE